METLSNLAFGLGIALSWQNILYCFIGCFLGTVVGVLPGIGPVATVAMLLPFTFGLGPAPALIMLAGIYYGAQYGGSTTAILVNIPGESSSVVTTLDGYQMARRGRAGPALGIAAIGSFIAGCIATLVIAYFAPPLADVALKFGPADYFSLMVFGLVAAVVLARGSLLKAIAMVCFGILLGLIGTDVNSGVIRFAFGAPELADGLGFVALAMAFFGITDVVLNLEHEEKQEVFTSRIGSVLPTAQDLRACFWSIARGTALGSLLGILPGGGALLASFAAYMVEKKVAKPPRSFGEGDIRGVAAPESANNAGAQTSFIPMLTLGIPSNPTMALMIGALMIQGIAPGPQVMTERPELFWGLIASMWIGNLMLLVLNLPLVGLWIKLLAVPYRLLFPGDLRVLLHRRLHRRQQGVRRLRDRRAGGGGLRAAQARLRAGAHGAGIHSRADDGGEPAPHDDDLVRRLHGVHHPADLRRLPDRRRRAARRRRAPGPAREARTGDAGVSRRLGPCAEVFSGAAESQDHASALLVIRRGFGCAALRLAERNLLVLPSLFFLAPCACGSLSFSPVSPVIWLECHEVLLCGGLISYLATIYGCYSNLPLLIICLFALPGLFPRRRPSFTKASHRRTGQSSFFVRITSERMWVLPMSVERRGLEECGNWASASTPWSWAGAR